jgi:hypothetical protein
MIADGSWYHRQAPPPSIVAKLLDFHAKHPTIAKPTIQGVSFDAVSNNEAKRIGLVDTDTNVCAQPSVIINLLNYFKTGVYT